MTANEPSRHPRPSEPATETQAGWLTKALDQLVELAESLRGKIVVHCVNALGFEKQRPHRLDLPEGSAAEQTAATLTESSVVAAFHHLSAITLLDPEVAEIDSAVLVLGDDRDATDPVQELAGWIAGCRGVFAGRFAQRRPSRSLRRKPDRDQQAIPGARIDEDHRRLTTQRPRPR